MDDDEHGPQTATSRAGERQQRLAAALRENLRRRKAQARARTQTGHEQAPAPAEEPPTPPDSRDRPDSDG